MMFNSWEFSDNEFKRQKPGHKRPMRMTGCRESLHRQQHYLILVLLACCFLYPLTATAGNGFPRGDYYNQSPSSEILSYIPNCPSGDTEDTERFTDVPAGWFALGLRPDIANDGQYIINKHNAPVSSWNSFGTNFLVKNFTEAPDRDDPDFYFELCAAYWGTESEAWEREYMIEWDTRHSELLLNSDVQGSFSGSNIIDAWPVSLTAGYTYTFTLSITSLVDSDDYPGGADLHLFLIKDTGQWLNQDDAVYDLEVHHATSASAGGEYVVGTSAGGNYVVVVVNNSASYEYLGDPRPQGDYVIHIEGSAAPSDMPNLVVDSIGVGNPVVDSPVTIGFYVKNVGDAAAGASESQVTVDGVVQCASIAVNPLASGDVDSQTCTVPALQAGSHSVTVCANSGNSVDEGNENDNCLQRDFVVQEAYTPRPDLKLKSVGPVSAVEGENVYVYAFVENIGDAPAPASVGRVWVDQTLICDGTLHLDALVAGEQTFTDSCNVGPLAVGTHTLTVYVNNPSSFDEDSTDNNYLDNVTITITPAP
ncbi:MAG TPA: hypothetical protein ENK84_06175, partial [Desulfobulbus sp.]|nr:hypothetical protein [Desulfobulbus sp.]